MVGEHRFPSLSCQHSRKVTAFREWICEEAARARAAAADYIRDAVIAER